MDAASADRAEPGAAMQPYGLAIYIAASFRHLNGVRLLGKELARMGCRILDWTCRAAPPPGLTPMERRLWMDTDQAGGQVYAFCRAACAEADLVIYYGSSGQDAGVEIGLAAASGVPVLGIRGPLEQPGLMLHGAASAWVEHVEDALKAIGALLNLKRRNWLDLEKEPCAAARALALKMCLNQKPAFTKPVDAASFQG